MSSPNKPFAPVGDDDDIQELPPPVKSEPADSSGSSSVPTAQDNFSPRQASYALTTPEDYQEDDYGDFEQYEDSVQYHASVQDNIQAKGNLFQDPSDLLQFVSRKSEDG